MCELMQKIYVSKMNIRVVSLTSVAVCNVCGLLSTRPKSKTTTTTTKQKQKN